MLTQVCQKNNHVCKECVEVFWAARTNAQREFLSTATIAWIEDNKDNSTPHTEFLVRDAAQDISCECDDLPGFTHWAQEKPSKPCFDTINSCLSPKYSRVLFLRGEDKKGNEFCVCRCLRSTLESSSCGKRTRKEMNSTLESSSCGEKTRKETNSVYVAVSEVLSSLLPAGRGPERKRIQRLSCLRSTLESSSCGKRTRKEMNSTLESSSCGEKTRKETNSVYVAVSEVLSSLLPAGRGPERNG
jgi:hypothetical protein